jgi:mannose-6-phosphate isomerase
VTVAPTGAEADLIACYVPNLQRDIIDPLRTAGHSDDAIRALGEVAL